MAKNLGLLATNVTLLRTRATRHAYTGTTIAVGAALMATALVDFLPDAQLSLQGMWQAQVSNVALWLLDLMPFIFAFWGQYVSVVLSHEAGAMVVDQTSDLRAEKIASEVTAQRRSTLDRLTGLPNRELCLDRTGQAIQHAHRAGEQVGLLVIDIHEFTEINKTLGQHGGDRVLQRVANRLRDAIDEPATVARIGADNYAILLPRITSTQALVEASRRVSRALESPIPMQNVNLTVQCCMGGSLYPGHAVDAETLLNYADLAMHEAKSDPGTFQIYRPEGHKNLDPARLSLVAELRKAIQLDQLELFVQPIVNYANKEFQAVEALVRWQHPERGLLMPGEFIPRAERSGLINELTRWVVKRALALIQDMARNGLALRVSVNIPARTLLDTEFPDMVAGFLAAHELRGSCLTLEITEDTLMSEQISVEQSIRHLADMGLQFSIDDFGTGYSQLAYLKRLPVSEIKIDRSFIQDMLDSRVDASIVEATINLAHALNMKVVAEGIETCEQAEHLVSLKCNSFQGFYICRPIPAKEFHAWFKSWDGSPDAGWLATSSIQSGATSEPIGR